MFITSRITVIDDNPDHLTGIKESLNSLRLDCHTKLYNAEAVTTWEKLPGTRILFLDQNLIADAAFGGSKRAAFAALAEVIKTLIDPQSGPYGLVLWAAEPDLENLKNFLFDRFKDNDTQFLPVFFSALQKANYLNTATGSVQEPEKLKNDVNLSVSKNAQLQALLAWEADISVSINAVLRSIVDLVPSEKRSTDGFADEIGKILFRLSQTGAGINRAKENPREAINRVLVPILSDRILEHDPDAGNQVDWNKALVAPSGSASLSLQASVNSAVHLSPSGSLGSSASDINPTDLGAVVSFPFDSTEDALSDYFGVTEKQLRGELFRAKKQEWSDCTLRLIQIGASCDHAQPKLGPLLYLLGIEWAFAKEDGSYDDEKPTMWLGDKERFGRMRPWRESEWQSPVLLFPGTKRIGKLSIFKNLSLSIPRPVANDHWTSIYRLREELINELTQEYARYISRPGVLSLPS